jgi:conserved oligomeric Golgi complex subunit 2
MTALPSIEDLTSNLAGNIEIVLKQSDLELPSISPLSHSNPYLKPDGKFDVDSFLLSRSAHSSLPELRLELREYLSELKAELVQLLNDDYESFISLSTDLRAEGSRLERMKSPLEGIKLEIQVGVPLLCALLRTFPIYRNQKVNFNPFKIQFKQS